MTRPVHYDNTILIRLSSEMKEAFYAVCKARGVAPSEHARKLMTDYVLNHWGVDKPKSSDTIALERCDTTLICSQLMTSHQQKQTTSAPTSAPKSPQKEKKALSIYNGQVNYLPIFLPFGILVVYT